MTDHSQQEHGKYEMFEARVSDDDVKTDLELTCVLCGAVLCDIEHGDTIATLMRVIDDHVCSPDEDDLDFARDTLGPDATDDEVYDLAQQRLSRDAGERP